MGDVRSHRGTPIDGLFSENPNLKWMRTEGTISGNHHVENRQLVVFERMFIVVSRRLCGCCLLCVMYFFPGLNSGVILERMAGWWFGTFYIFAYIGNNHPN